MTDRITKIVIRGDISDFQAKMVAAGRSIGAASDKMTNASKESKKWRDGLKSVGDTAGKMGLAAAAGVAVVVAAAANFDQSMSNIKAATHESADNMELLRAAAIKAGADTKFSAGEAAGAIENLAKAGVSTQDVLGGGLNGALSLAAAGSLDVAEAAEIAARAMAQFGLDGNQVPHVADLLSAAAGKAVGEVSDFGMALNQAGLVAAQTGLSIEETTGALAAFAQSGLQGSDAGTSLKTMLQSLTPSGEKAASAMDSLGIHAYDSQGKFVGLAKYAGILQGALKGMSAEQQNATLKTIFGSDAVRAAAVLYKEGAGGIQDWIDKVNDQGYAAETAAIKMDNLKGDLEQFKGSLETALIGGGEGSQSFLRFIVQDATGAVNALNGLPPAIKNVGLGLGALTAITGGGLFVGARFIGALADGRSALSNLGITSDDVGKKLKSFGTGSVNLVADQAKAAGQAFEEMSGKQLALRGGAAVIGTLALSLNHLDDSADRATRTMGAFANIGAGALVGFAAGGPVGAAIGGGVSAISSLVGALHGSDDASRTAADGAKEYAGTLNEVTGAATGATRALVANRLEQDGILKAAGELGLNTETLVSGILGQGDAAKKTQASLAALSKQYQLTADDRAALADAGTSQFILDDIGRRRLQAVAVDKVSNAYQVESDAVSMSQAATDRQALAVDGSTASMDTNTTSLQDNAKAIDDEIKARDKLAKAALGAIDAESAYQQAIDDGTKRLQDKADLQSRIAEAQSQGTTERASLQSELGSAKTASERKRITDQIAASWKQQNKEVADLKKQLQDYDKTLDLHTQAGRDNMAVVTDQAKAWNGLSKEQQNAKGAYKDARDQLIQTAKQFGATDKEAQGYAKHLLDVPTDITTKLMLDKQKAQADLEKFKKDFYGLTPKTVELFLKTTTAKQEHQLGDPKVATGGYITGPGSGTSDSIPAWLSNGEYVIKADAVARYGVDTLHRINAMRFANGGYVNRAVAAQQASNTTNYYTASGDGIDYERLALAVAGVRPLYGDVHIQPHNYSEFTRQMAGDRRAASLDGVRR